MEDHQSIHIVFRAHDREDKSILLQNTWLDLLLALVNDQRTLELVRPH